MQAIGQYVLVKKKNVKVIIFRASFHQRIIDAISTTTCQIPQTLPPGDLLCIDDIQFLGGKNVRRRNFSHVQYTFRRT